MDVLVRSILALNYFVGVWEAQVERGASRMFMDRVRKHFDMDYSQMQRLNFGSGFMHGPTGTFESRHASRSISS